jgi:hypothetical protein
MWVIKCDYVPVCEERELVILWVVRKMQLGFSLLVFVIDIF